MAVGLTYNKNQVDQSAGSISRDLLNAFDRAHNFSNWLAATPDADLANLGYAPEDLANLRSAFGDAAQLYDIYTGAAALPTAKDFRAFMQRLWGLPVA